MAVLKNTNLTLADWGKRRDPDGSIAVITNILSQSNEILDDAVHKMANGSTGHLCTIATGLPDVSWRQFNQGIQPSKGSTAQVTEGIGMLETRSEVDRALAKLDDDVNGLRLSETTLRLEAMAQEMARTIFYGNTSVDPEQFMGLSPRYSSLGAGNAQNILSAGGTTASEQTSIWLVGWGDETVHCCFPKGSSAGLEQEDLGVLDVDVHNAAGAQTGKMRAYVDWFCWKAGLVVQDWRYAVRIPNIEVGHLQTLTSTQAPTGAFDTSIIHRMAEATYRLPNIGKCRPAFYVNRTTHAALSRMAMEKHTAAVTTQPGLSQFGTSRQYMSFLDIPIRRCDALLLTEEIVV